MAAVFAPSILLGERPDQLLDSVPWSPPSAPWDDETAAMPPLVGAAGGLSSTSLLALGLRVEHHPASDIGIAAEDLPEALRCRAALAALARRAHRRGKTLRLSGGTPDLRSMATSEGWVVDRGARIAPEASAFTAPSIGVARSIQSVSIIASPGDAPTVHRSVAPSSAPAPQTQVGRAAGHRWRLHWPTVVWPRMPQLGRQIATSALVRLGPPKNLAAAAVAGALTGTVALVGAVILVPSATVTLTPAMEQITLDVPVVVDPAAKKPDVAKGVLPGRTISKEVSETQQAPATGRKPAPDARATGEVVFINKTEKPVSVPKGTIVLAGGVRFATQQDLNVGGTVFSGPQQRISMQRVTIQAVNGGLEGNVNRFQIAKIDGPLGQQLDVQNDAATRGGSEKTVTFVTADDRRKLQEALTKSLSDKLMQQVKGQLPSPDKETLVPWAGQNPSVVEAVFSKNEGDDAQTFSLALKLRYGATAFGNDAYNSLVKQVAAQRASQLRPGFQLGGKGVTAVAPEIQGIQDGAVRLLGRAQGTLVPHLEAGTVRAGVANRRLAEAQAFAQALPGVTRAEVTASPGWLGRTPLLGWRVAVRSGS